MEIPLDEEHVRDLFADIINRHGRQLVTMPTPFPGTIFDLPLSDDSHIMPTLDPVVVRSIAKHAAQGNTTAMYTLSRLYMVGMGVPRNPQLAYCWSQFSLTEASLFSFEEAVRALKHDVDAIKDCEFVYPEILDVIYDSMVPQYEEITIDTVNEALHRNKRFYAMPMYSGVRMFLIYRVDEETKTCYLYDMRAGGKYGDRISLDVAASLKIPVTLGDLRNRNTIPDYLGRMSDHIEGKVTYLVVAGTLLVDPKKLPYLKRAMPSITKASQLFSALVASKGEMRIPYKDSKEFVDTSAKIARVSYKIDSINNGTYIDELRDRFAKAKREYAIAKRARNAEGMINAKEAGRKLKKEREIVEERPARYLEYLDANLRNLQEIFETVKKNNNEQRELHNAKYPENSFLFQATDLYYGQGGRVTPMPVGNHIYTHLSSLGFMTTFNTCLFEPCSNTVWTFDTSENKIKRFLQERYAAFEKDLPYKMSGLLLRDSETVNSKRSHVTFICYFNKSTR